MTSNITKTYKVSGSGVLCIDANDIFVLVEDKGTFNLATVLADLNDKHVEFSFSYDEDYEDSVDEEAGEVT
jgi:hypothetical protein